ncbi:hypothetical protein D9619_011721 [Psilocybe cf. subviscida]|uniref:Uncharacterized protein n=1 Tax=Psilocybe cf. subviscida TaxID=2480587 RepID=A0A8H5BTN0_9AGAR|nr:hypothetical protein D9619_011721 [Psilocybe cf. subviscida]
MTRGRKLSVSSIREKVEKILGKDDNPYGLPPIAKDPDSDNKLFGIHDPARIPVIGKLLPKPKTKAVVTRRRRSSSLPARHKAIYAENPPDVEILPEHLAEFDRKEKAYYDFFPDLRPCMTVEEFNEEFAKWDAKCNIRHLKKKPQKLYRWERKFGSRELLNPRPAPKPPGFVERPKSKALPPVPTESDDRSTRDTDFLISQFPPPPDAIPSMEVSATNPQRPVQRRRSGSEGTKPRGQAAVNWCLGLKFAPDVRSELCHKDDDSYAATMSRPPLVHHVHAHDIPLPPSPSRGRFTTRSRHPSITTPTAQAMKPETTFVNMFRAPDGDSSGPAQPAGGATTSMIAAELTAWGEEIAREEAARNSARAEALRKLEKNQKQPQDPFPQPQNAHREREHPKNEHGEPAKPEKANHKEESQRKNEDERHRQVGKEYQRQRLKSEPKPRRAPPSSSTGTQEQHRERQPHDEHRQRKASRPQAEDATRTPKSERDRHENKSEREHQRERNKSEPKRHAPSSSSAVAQEKRRERQPEDTTRVRVESRAQADTRRRIVRRSVSASKLYDMVQSKSQIVHIPAPPGPPKGEVRKHVNAGAPLTEPPAHPLPSLPITPITPSNVGVRVAAAGSNSTAPPVPVQGHAPTVVRPRPSRPNLGPPPSLSAGTAQRSRAPSTTQRSGCAEEKPPALKKGLVGAVLHRKASNSSLDHQPLDKSTISAPVDYIKGGETGFYQLRHARLHVQDLQVTMIPLPYYVQYPPTPESIAPKAGDKAQGNGAAGTNTASEATTPAPQSASTSPAPVQTAQRPVHLVYHTVNGSTSSASSYGSSSSNTHGYTTSSSNHEGYASSATTHTHHGYVQRSYEDCISPAVGKIILPAALKNGYPSNPPSASEPRAKKTSLTPMHIHLPNTGTLGGGSRPAPQFNAVASSSRNVIDNMPKDTPPPAAVDPEFEDEELIRGYKPRKFVDVKKMIREEEDRIRRERKDLPAIPFPVAPLRIRKKVSQL